MKEKIPLNYRFTLVLLFLLGMQTAIYGQNYVAMNTPTYENQNFKALKEVLSELEKKHGVYIVYESGEIDQIKVEEKYYNFSTVQDVLKNISEQYGIQYERVNNDFYVISKKKSKRNLDKKKSSVNFPQKRSTPQQLNSIRRIELQMIKQSRTISGKVTTLEDNSPLPGVNVLAKGTSVGTVTDVNGTYSISVPEEANTLVFSYVGYTSEEIQIGNRSVVDVALTPDIETLSEIVVVGYGTQERAQVTGAITSVGEKEIRQLAVPSVEQALQGQAAGVLVSNTGAPGQGATIRIRGTGTLNNNNPLFVVDGIPSVG
ncbi:TonB-dependent receptor plug domain-containing protein, partial [Candidatus Peregrinibacteria bacterium]|nr:TonB-dependent receptor plug domain-containing protein [Candidatus Peregrinibacteria bacterium]